MTLGVETSREMNQRRGPGGSNIRDVGNSGMVHKQCFFMQRLQMTWVVIYSALL